MMKVLVEIENLSMGDVIASMPYVSKFQQLNQDKDIHVSMNDELISYLQPAYLNLKMIGKNPITIFDKVIPLVYNYNKPLQQSFAENLGFFNAPYIKPTIIIPNMERPIKNKYITIGVHSTSQLKYWNHPRGKNVQRESPYWNELCGMIRKEGYTPVVLEKNELFGDYKYFNGLPNKANKKYGQSLLESMNYIYHSSFYIGLSSGMSWVAHAMGKKVAMIANFTEDWNEFDLSSDDYIRITNKSVCHGCWNDPSVAIDVWDWYHCPKHKGTERQFECHTSITPEMVFKQIEKWM